MLPFAYILLTLIGVSGLVFFFAKLPEWGERLGQCVVPDIR